MGVKLVQIKPCQFVTARIYPVTGTMDSRTRFLVLDQALLCAYSWVKIKNIVGARTTPMYSSFDQRILLLRPTAAVARPEVSDHSATINISIASGIPPGVFRRRITKIPTSSDMIAVICNIAAFEVYIQLMLPSTLGHGCLVTCWSTFFGLFSQQSIAYSLIKGENRFNNRDDY